MTVRAKPGLGVSQDDEPTGVMPAVGDGTAGDDTASAGVAGVGDDTAGAGEAGAGTAGDPAPDELAAGKGPAGRRG